MKRTLIIATLALMFSAIAGAQPYVITQNDKDRAAEIVSKMTLDEKIEFISLFR